MDGLQAVRRSPGRQGNTGTTAGSCAATHAGPSDTGVGHRRKAPTAMRAHGLRAGDRARSERCLLQGVQDQDWVICILPMTRFEKVWRDARGASLFPILLPTAVRRPLSPRHPTFSLNSEMAWCNCSTVSPSVFASRFRMITPISGVIGRPAISLSVAATSSFTSTNPSC